MHVIDCATSDDPHGVLVRRFGGARRLMR